MTDKPTAPAKPTTGAKPGMAMPLGASLNYDPAQKVRDLLPAFRPLGRPLHLMDRK